jgi:hypothetical protein
MPNEAKRHLDECRESARQLANYIESTKLKVPPADQFERRIRDALYRLQEEKTRHAQSTL